MSPFADYAIFVILPIMLWRITGKRVPIVVLPIMTGVVLATAPFPGESLGVPSTLGRWTGHVAIIGLAFIAGLEVWHADQDVKPCASNTAAGLPRMLLSAMAALAIPLAAGTLIVHLAMSGRNSWLIGEGGGILGAVAIGLCLSVSALPVLIGIVREIPSSQRALGTQSLKLAVIDDAALWSGLALLLVIADHSAASGTLGSQITAILILASLVALTLALQKRWRAPPTVVVLAAMPLYLIPAVWSTMQLGLHELIGAFIAGVALPKGWTSRLPLRSAGMLLMVWATPLFFGHSALNAPASILSMSSLVTAFIFFSMAALTKMTALTILPPVAGMAMQDRILLGSLLQCKGLMEIVAATILFESGLITREALGVLIVVALMSTIVTLPLFRVVQRLTIGDRRHIVAGVG